MPVRIERYENPTNHLTPPTSDPPPGHRWARDSTDVEIDGGRIRAVVVWRAVPAEKADADDNPFDLDPDSLLGEALAKRRHTAAAGIEPGSAVVQYDDYEALSEERDELEELLEKREQRIDELEDEVDTLRAGREELSNALEERTDERDHLHRRVSKLDRILYDIAEAADIDPDEYTEDQIAESAATLLDERDRLKEERDDAVESLKSDRLMAQELRERVDDLKGQLDARDARIEELEERVQRVENERDAAVEELSYVQPGGDVDTDEADQDDDLAEIHQWQSAESLGERLDISAHGVTVAAGKYEGRVATSGYPIDRRQRDGRKEYRIDPESEFELTEDAEEADDEPSGPDQDLTDDDASKFWVCEEVLDGFNPRKRALALPQAEDIAESFPEDEPAILRVHESIDVDGEIQWEHIDATDGIEVLQ